MAAAVGEASAIATFLQLGFSLAKVLTTYIDDVKDTPEEIASLAREIDSTLRHLEELNALIDYNKAARIWNANGEALAQQCRADSERIIHKLLKLLRKSGSSVAVDGLVTRQDIDISVSSRLSWPLLKQRLKVAKLELEQVRIKILLLGVLYTAKAGYVFFGSLMFHVVLTVTIDPLKLRELILPSASQSWCMMSVRQAEMYMTHGTKRAPLSSPFPADQQSGLLTS